MASSTDENQWQDEENKLSQESKELIHSLPREKGCRTPHLYFFQDFWCRSIIIQTINTFQNQFQAKDSDVVVSTFPKSGTTWLKALTFAIVNRHRFNPTKQNHPLLTFNPHQLVPFFEVAISGDAHVQTPHFTTEPRLFGTHSPFPSLAKSIKESNYCRIIYICRNPFDTFVSTWIFFNKIKAESLPTLTLEEAFERYCKGINEFGPFWSHVLGYWNESLAKPNKVLFLKYEDLIEDANFHVKRVAEFLGCSFTHEEESNGVVEDIVELCSFDKMKELEVNKFATLAKSIEARYLFREAKIGDWVNYLSPSMVEKLSKIIEEKLSGSGLSFRYS